MIILIKIYIYILRCIYFFLKILPTNEKKIFFLSRQTNTPSLDFRLIINELKKNNSEYKIVVITKRVEKKITAVISRNTFSIFKQMYHLATCKVCVIDGYNIPVSVLRHKKEMVVIQLWHSLGAIKMFGYQSLNTNKKKKIAQVFQMHKNYNYIISGSKAMIPYFAQAFGYDKDKFLPYGLPRIDYLLRSTKKNRRKIYNKYPNFKNQKVILYAPTFRDNNSYKIEELIQAIDTQKYTLIIKLHPNIKLPISSNSIYLCEEFSSLQLLSVADYVITDYSAISIEASIINKPVFLYVYDIEEYSKYPGINIDLYKEFPNYIFKDAKKLYKTLSKENYEKKVIENYKIKYTSSLESDSTKEITTFIVKQLKK